MPINPLAQIPNELVPNITITQNGWSPELGLATRINEDLTTSIVFQVVDWVGGVAKKPAVGEYIGETGYVLDIDDAVDVRGSSGTIQTTLTLLRLLVAPDSGTFYVTDLNGIFTVDTTDTTTSDDGLYTIVTANDKRFKKKGAGSPLVINGTDEFALVNNVNSDTVQLSSTSFSGLYKWFEDGYVADGSTIFEGKTGFWVSVDAPVFSDDVFDI